ncbi:MAG: hypothetical protein K2P76_08385 [Lachnospiraceae bacterium]|nr:hypothetical protein [Lachnospiraceae bacterium]
MDYKIYLDQYLREEKAPGEISIFLVTGCMEQYLMAETEEEKNFFLSSLKTITDKSSVRARNLFVLHDALDHEFYRGIIEDKMESLRQCPRNSDGIFCESAENPVPKPWDFLYEAYPFYMSYETYFHNKADYGDFYLQMRKFEPAMIRSVTWEDACFLMMLIDVIDSMSQEIFEHYRALKEIFKRTIKKSIPPLTSQEVDKKAGLAMGYVIVKACSIKVLNSEKYVHIGLSLIDAADGALEDEGMAGLSMMADSVKRQFLKYE